MTEIRIRNGIPRNLPTQWYVRAWDSIRNDNDARYTNIAGAQYSQWDEWNLQNTFIMASTWGIYDGGATVATLLPQRTTLGTLSFPDSATYPPNTSLGDVTLYPSYFTKSWVYQGIPYSLATITVWGAVIQFNITDLSLNLRTLLITVGTADADMYPNWSAVSMNYWWDASNQHDYFECRIGNIVKKVKINQFQRDKPHLYAIRRDVSIGNLFHFYVDSMLIASNYFPSGVLWTAANSTNTYNMWWYLSDYGYAPSPGALGTNPITYALFRIDMDIAYDHSHILLLCKSRYYIDDSGILSSTHTTILNAINFCVFDGSLFPTVFL